MARKGEKRFKERCAQRLGMDLAAARKKLVNYILLDFLQQLGQDNCWQCGRKIQSVSDLTIEHIEPWSSSEDPVAAYFDLKNISFSHKSCNSQKIRNNPQSRYCNAQDAEVAKDRIKSPTGYRYVMLYKHKDFPIRYMARVPHWVNGKRIKTHFGKAKNTPLEAALDADQIMTQLYGDQAVTNKLLGLL
jgi:hypothetical protein